MGLFDKYFKRNKKESTDENDVLQHLMVDWFVAAKLDIKDYQTDFHPKMKQVFNKQEYINKIIENSEEEQKMLDVNIAFIFLIYYSPKRIYLQKLREIYRDTTIQPRPRQWISTNFSTPSYEENPELEFLQKTASLIWSISNKLHEKRNPFKDLNKIKGLKINNSEGFIRLFNFIKDINSDNKFVSLLDIYCFQQINYQTFEFEQISEDVQNLLIITLNEEVAKYNKNDYFQFDIDYYYKFYKLYTYKSSLKKWRDTDYKKIANFKPQDFDEIQNFLSENDTEKILKHFIFYQKHHVCHQEFDKYFLLQLIENIEIKETVLFELLQIYPTYNEILVDTLYIPLSKSLKIAYNTSVRNHLEKLIVRKGAKATHLKFLTTISNGISEKIKRTVIQSKYSGWYSVINTVYGHNQFSFSINILKKVLKDISKIAELAVLQTKDAYYEELGGYTTGIKIKHNGIEKLISMDGLNTLLFEDKTGFQLVSVPIKMDEIIKTEYHNGVTYLCGVSFLNEEQFNYLINEYLPEHFPDINPDKHYAINKYNHFTSLTFKEHIKEISKNVDTSNLFLSDNNWKWFKEKHVDELPNAKDWYALMHEIVSYSGSKKPSKKWKNNMQLAINKHGEKLYYKELRTLINSSINEDFWYFDTNRNALKGIAWSCSLTSNAISLLILKEIVDKAYKKVPSVGPRSGVVGNAVLEVLIAHSNTDSFGILNLLRNQTKYTRFANVLDKYIDKYIDNSDEDEQLLADKAIPNFDFVHGEKIVVYPEFSVRYFIKNKKLNKRWLVNSKEVVTTPVFVKENHPKLIKEVAAEFKGINTFFKAVKTRIKTYWLFNRKWNFEEWDAFIYGKELLNPWLQGLVWHNETQNNTFLLINNDLFDLDKNLVTPKKEDVVSLWHPITAKSTDIHKWQNFIVSHHIEQSERQVFREYYPFSKTELNLLETPRFNHHFLMVKKLMAIANASGWIFTYVHDDVNWPRKYIKNLDVTVHLKCDYNRNDFAIPTKSFFFTKGDTRKITYNLEFDKLQFSIIPSTTLSEICRDIDLFIAITSVAHDVKLSSSTELLKHYREDFTNGKFSENAQAAVRKQIIELIGVKIGLKNFSFEKNYLMIIGSLNNYAINLGSGFAQIKDTKKHITLIPDVTNTKKITKKVISILDDETLYIILSKALFLQNDASITDEKMITLLKSS